jgi:hypothetical protein
MVEFLASVIGALAAGALSKAGDVGGRAVTDAYNALRVVADPELGQHAETLRAAVAGAAVGGGVDIEVGDITGKVNVLVNNLVASGRIKLGDIRAETGDATLTNVTAGASASKKA